MASGMPSRRCADLLDAPRRRRRRSRGPRPARARRRGARPPASDGTRQATSPSQRSGSRLVARTRTPGPGAQQVLGQARAGVDHVLAVVEHDDRLAVRQVRGEGLLRRALGRDRDADGQRGRLGHAARRRSDRRARRTRCRRGRGSIRDSVSMARRVLPQPPGPISVSSRTRSSRRTISPRSRSRPTNDVSGRGRLPRVSGAGVGSEQLAVQPASLGIGLGRQLGVELLAQQLVLRQRLLAAARWPRRRA